MLKIELRHYQTLENGLPMRYIGSEPKSLVKTTTEPEARVPNHVYTDYTQNVKNLDDITFLWQIGDNGNHMKAEIEGEVVFSGAAATFIRDWLVNRAYSPFNAIEVRFTDLGRKPEKIIGEYIIKPQKISNCLNDGCDVSVSINSNDLLYQCIQKTQIGVNNNGFLNKEFRAYDYCVEKRPAVMTAAFIMLGAFVFIPAMALAFAGAIFNFIMRLVGSSFRVPSFTEIKEAYWKMVGFGRVHAAAGARDYIDNVCEHCGVSVDTAKHFLYQQTILHRGVVINNPYFWLDILFASSEKGRGDSDPNRFKLIEQNVPLISLTDLLDDLGMAFNSRWYLTTDNRLRFIRKWERATNAPILDFTTIPEKRIFKLCHDITDKQQPLTAVYGYQQDSIDLSANDALLRFNSTISFDSDGNVNPYLKGHQDNTVPFGAVRFRGDNLTEDYIDEATGSPLVFIGAFGVIVIAAAFFMTSIGLTSTLIGATGGIPLAVIAGALVASAVAYLVAGGLLDLSFKFAIVMSQDVCSLPKLLIRKVKQDGRVDDARVQDDGAGSTKQPNTLFNTKTYDNVHTYNNETPVEHLINYPMFYDAKFQDNVFDICFNPADIRNNAITERETQVEFLSCSDELDLLGVYAGQDIAIDERFEFSQELAGDATFVPNTARIEDIKVNFVTRRVELRGVNWG
jgi:hypothetical protein